jgi:hypothetical protein
MNSEITLQEALFDSGIIDKFGCCKIFINDKVLWDDDVALWEYIRLEEAWEKYKIIHSDYKDYRVIKIDIEIVDFHHSIIRVYCEK